MDADEVYFGELYAVPMPAILQSPPHFFGGGLGRGRYRTRTILRTSMRMRVCVSHTRFQIRTRSDVARGFTASLIYAALSGESMRFPYSFSDSYSF